MWSWMRFESYGGGEDFQQLMTFKIFFVLLLCYVKAKAAWTELFLLYSRVEWKLYWFGNTVWFNDELPFES